MTPRNPRRSASADSSTNSSGRTQRDTGWWRTDGRRYCVIVMRSQPASCSSAERLDDLLGGLAHAEDEVRLGDQPGLVRPGDHRERPVVAEAGADRLEDAGDGLEVVREHLGLRREDLVEQLGRRVEVRDEQLDAGAGVDRVDLADGLGVEPGAAVGQVVAGHAGDGRVLQAHRLHGRGDAAGLVGVEVGRLARVDLAEVAAPRALVAADEERGLAVLPALEDVGAAGFLAHRVQALALHQALELGVLGAHRRARADPLGLALDGGLGVARLDAEHASAIGCDRHAGQTNPPSGDGCGGVARHTATAGRASRIGTSVSTRCPRTRGSDLGDRHAPTRSPPTAT